MKDKKPARSLRPIMFFLQAGWMIASPVILLTFFGWWLDRRWDISPWLTLVGCVLGLLTGGLNFYKLALTMYLDVEKDEEEDAYRAAYRTGDGRDLPPDELILPGDLPPEERSRTAADKSENTPAHDATADENDRADFADPSVSADGAAVKPAEHPSKKTP